MPKYLKETFYNKSKHKTTKNKIKLTTFDSLRKMIISVE